MTVIKSVFASLFFFFVWFSGIGQSSDFIPGNEVIFEDNFEQDAVGDLPAKWSSSGSGEVVTLDRLPGKWFKISSPTAVNPELTEALPENCTIEFDLFLKNTTGIAPHIMFGLTNLSDVSAGDVYRNHVWVVLKGYNDNNEVKYGKTINDLGSSTFKLSGFVGRKMRVSISVNKTRFRVYLGSQKVFDAPKLLTEEYRNNFFIAASTVLPEPEEGVYFSNVRIAKTGEDARSLLIKQLLQQGSVMTSDIQFSPPAPAPAPTDPTVQDPNNNQGTVYAPAPQLEQTAYPLLDTIGQTMLNDPNMNIQINGMETAEPGIVLTEQAVKQKADQIRDYLVNKYNLTVDRFITTGSTKLKEGAEKLKSTKAGKMIHSFITEFIKL